MSLPHQHLHGRVTVQDAVHTLAGAGSDCHLHTLSPRTGLPRGWPPLLAWPPFKSDPQPGPAWPSLAQPSDAYGACLI